MDSQIHLRPMTPDDMTFLEKLYASTRQEEMQQSGWPQAQIDVFLKQQFTFQHKYYQEHYSDSAFDVIMSGSEPIGRLYLQERKNERRIVDIALIPKWRGKGIGAQLLKEIMETARNQGKAVGIHVEANNPAMRLYKRLGFKKVGDTGVYFHMEWNPGS